MKNPMLTQASKPEPEIRDRESGIGRVDALRSQTPDPRSPSRPGAWAWALVPLLAVVAFAPVLSLWFVGDDFGHMTVQQLLPWPGPFLQFSGGTMFYRPLSTSLTWELGFALFGTNALPYHALSLGLHALAAWLLARVVATISGEARTGWLAGALFAVYSLCTEPVAWLASQWDAWAAVCVLGAVWGFAVAWKTQRQKAESGGQKAEGGPPAERSLLSAFRLPLPYLAGLVAAFLAVMMKESALPLPLVLPFVAIATQWRVASDGWLVPELQPTLAPERSESSSSLAAATWRAVLWTLPYSIPTLLFVGLRVSTGGIGGYPGVRTDWQHFLLDNLFLAALKMLRPLNNRVFDSAIGQIVGLLMVAGVLAGLVLWGRRRWPLLLLASAWWLLFLLPAANLVLQDTSVLIGNRVLYFSLMGFCMALAVVLAGLLDAPERRKPGWALVVALLALAVPATWLQLQPWQQTSRQARHMVDEMARLIAPLSGRRVQINVANLPMSYKGSYLFVNGFDQALAIFNHQLVRSKTVDKLDPRQLAAPLTGRAGTYNLEFALDHNDELYYVSQLSGITVASAPPATGPGGQVWDYTRCGAPPDGWQPKDATFGCARGPREPPAPGTSYASFDPASPDGGLLLPDLRLDLSGSRWLRLGICARLPTQEADRLGEWFWGTSDRPAWSQDHSHAFLLDSTGAWRNYWTYLPTTRLGAQLQGLRFDPVNDRLPIDIQWIALDLIR